LGEFVRVLDRFLLQPGLVHFCGRFRGQWLPDKGIADRIGADKLVADRSKAKAKDENGGMADMARPPRPTRLFY
jgi:hypothetical protein